MLDTGNKLEKLELIDINGQSFDIANYKGKKLAIYFWASWWNCRTQLPGWQSLAQKAEEKSIELINISLDFQGPEKVIPYLQEYGIKIKTFIDVDNSSGLLFGFKVVPNLLIFDEDLTLKFKCIANINILKNEHKLLVENWIDTGDLESLNNINSKPGSIPAKESVNVLREGNKILETGQGDVKQLLKNMVSDDPENFIFRKQYWAINNPEKFYSGKIDTDWQRKKLENNED